MTPIAYVPVDVTSTVYSVKSGGAGEIVVEEAKVLRVSAKTLVIEIARTYSEPYSIRVDRVPVGSREGSVGRDRGTVYYSTRAAALVGETEDLHSSARRKRESADEQDARAARAFFMASTGKEDPDAERLQEERIEAYRREREDRIAERGAL